MHQLNAMQLVQIYNFINKLNTIIVVIEIISRSDIEQVKNEILNEINTLINLLHKPAVNWVKSKEACKVLNCSGPTLTKLRYQGTVNPKKIGGSWYYSIAEIKSLLNQQIIA